MANVNKSFIEKQLFGSKEGADEMLKQSLYLKA